MDNNNYYFIRKWQDHVKRTDRYNTIRDIIFLLVAIILIAGQIAMVVTIDRLAEAINNKPEQLVYIMPEETPEEGEVIVSTYEQAKIDIFEACEARGLDFNLAFAIARLETGNFTSKAFLEYNNYGGISRKEKPLRYETPEDGLNAYMVTLEAYKGMSVDKMSKKYCPGNAVNWAKSVKSIMKEEM